MKINENLPYGSTPLEEHEIEGLIPSTITTRRELDEWEQKNILEAEKFILSRRRTAMDILTDKFLRRLHREMFGNVWKWAGRFRTRDKNIGVAFHKISSDLKVLLDDAAYWVANKTYHEDEIAVRFHHRLVHIHPFPNGNGRHARLAADLLVVSVGKERFFWGHVSLNRASELRKCYIDALVTADRDFNYRPLLQFARAEAVDINPETSRK